MQWYAHNGSEQLGPLPAEDLHEKIRSGALLGHHLAWREGMPQWKAISEIAELKLESPTPVIAAPTPPARSDDLSALIEIAALPEKERAEPTGMISRPEAPARKIRWKPIFAVGLTAGLAAGVVLNIDLILNAIPKFKKPLVLEGLSPAQLETLQTLSEQPKDVTHVDVALSQRTLYLVSNQPDGTAFSVHLQGVPATLLGRTRFSLMRTLTIKDHVATEDLTDLPTGEYRLKITPNREGATAQLVFVGAKKDADYQNRLQSFHTELKTKLQQECDTMERARLVLLQDAGAATPDYRRIVESRRPGEISVAEKALATRWAKTGQLLNESIGEWRLESLKENLKLWRLAQKLLLIRQMTIQGYQKAQEIGLWVTSKGEAETLQTLRSELKTLLQSRDVALEEFHTELKSHVERLGGDEWLTLLEAE